MKSLNMKLVLSALGIALLATPAFAQKPHRQASQQTLGQAPSATGAEFGGSVGVYPNPVTRTGSEWSVESGAEFNLMR